jgi:hypothetical protein
MSNISNTDVSLVDALGGPYGEPTLAGKGLQTAKPVLRIATVLVNRWWR